MCFKFLSLLYKQREMQQILTSEKQMLWNFTAERIFLVNLSDYEKNKSSKQMNH